MNCKSSRKTCRWSNIGKNCFRRSCCSTVVIGGKPLAGSTKCSNDKVKCRVTKKPNVNGFIKEIHVKWKDVVLNLLKKEKLLEMYVNNSIWKKDVKHLQEPNVLKLRREMDVIIW